MTKKATIILLLIATSFILPLTFDTSYAYKTGSYNFCSVFPMFPECVGWRTEPISDSYNHWFCDYVDLPKICENRPDSQKQISLHGQDFCCKFIGSEKIAAQVYQEKLAKQPIGEDSPNDSIEPLIIWTDKDHYNFKDRVTVYGKFDFSSFKIKKSVSESEFEQTGRTVNGTSIQTGRIIAETPVLDVDIKLNGKTVLRNIPVNENGWFVTFFYLNNRYTFSNQNNLLEVEYVLYDNVPLGGPKTHAIYHFTTGDIAKKENNYNIWSNEEKMPNKIRYGINVNNPEKFTTLMQQDLVITRLTTPKGYVVQIESDFSKDLSNEYSDFMKYGYGEYEIQVTYGENTSKITFVYQKP